VGAQGRQLPWATRSGALIDGPVPLISLAHRPEALDYALSFGRGLDRSKADRFVGMYVNDWTLDFGPRGREAVTRLLADGHAAGVIPKPVVPEFVE